MCLYSYHIYCIFFLEKDLLLRKNYSTAQRMHLRAYRYINFVEATKLSVFVAQFSITYLEMYLLSILLYSCSFWVIR